MKVRIIASKSYGNLGPFRQVHPGLFCSVSGRVHILGQGNIGGKAEGLAYLDQNQMLIPARNLFVADDYLNIPHQDIDLPNTLRTIDPDKYQQLISIVNGLGFPATVAIRSSSIMEDVLGHSQAGSFRSALFGKCLLAGEENPEFLSVLLEVLNSSYTRGRGVYLKHCFTEIPPLPIIIQELIGQKWSFAPNCYFPALAGIANTATPGKVKVQTVFGFGQAAVGWGLGRLHEFDNITFKVKKDEGFFNGDLYRIDLATGSAAEVDANLMYKASQLAKKYPALASLYQNKTPNLQRAIAQQALAIAKKLGVALDFEWALGGSDVIFTQVRPIKEKQAPTPRPIISPEKLLFETKKILGQGKAEVKYIICIFGEPIELKRDIKKIRQITAQYPESLIIWGTRVLPYVSRLILHDYLIHFGRSVLVLDYYGDDGVHHQSGPGTGLDHLSLATYDEKKVIFYDNEDATIQTLTSLGQCVYQAQNDQSSRHGTIKVFELPFPLQIAGDDEATWGLIYRG